MIASAIAYCSMASQDVLREELGWAVALIFRVADGSPGISFLYAWKPRLAESPRAFGLRPCVALSASAIHSVEWATSQKKLSERLSVFIRAGSSSKSPEKIAGCWNCALMTSSSGHPTPSPYLDARRFWRSSCAGPQEFRALRLAIVVFEVQTRLPT